ncbi:cation diffusion facilitator family transporter [Sulfurimonas sp. HSL3-7]|uniref:cation diffusion facilitator family transporter n=1 Tax=Sulfonitrofixus jiaomeiensis TaxID=3131938 RepID=UPI0031F74B3F
MSGHHHHEVKGMRLLITIFLNIIITAAQIIGGIYSGSLALLSDALHNFSDVMTLVITYIANRMAGRTPTQEKTFGYKRAEIIAALFNASVLVGTGFYLIIEAARRVVNPEPVGSVVVIALALLGIVFNAAGMLLIKQDAHHNINIKAAYLHLLTDVMTSVAVLAGGIAMYYLQLYWIDPLISILIAIYLIYAAYDILKDSACILMQFAPAHIDLAGIERVACGHPELKNIHHIHVWQLNDREIFLEAHVDFNENLPLEEVMRICDALEEKLKRLYGITHVTLQSEFQKKDDKALVCGAH